MPVLDWHIGDVLRKARRAKKLSTVALAKKARVNKRTINDYENHPERLQVAQRDTVEKILRVIGWTLADVEAEAERLRSGRRQPVDAIPPEERAEHEVLKRPERAAPD